MRLHWTNILRQFIVDVTLVINKGGTDALSDHTESKISEILTPVKPLIEPIQYVTVVGENREQNVDSNFVVELSSEIIPFGDIFEGDEISVEITHTNKSQSKAFFEKFILEPKESRKELFELDSSETGERALDYSISYTNIKGTSFKTGIVVGYHVKPIVSMQVKAQIFDPESTTMTVRMLNTSNKDIVLSEGILKQSEERDIIIPICSINPDNCRNGVEYSFQHPNNTGRLIEKRLRLYFNFSDIPHPTINGGGRLLQSGEGYYSGISNIVVINPYESNLDNVKMYFKVTPELQLNSYDVDVGQLSYGMKSDIQIEARSAFVPREAHYALLIRSTYNVNDYQDFTFCKVFDPFNIAIGDIDSISKPHPLKTRFYPDDHGGVTQYYR